MPRAAPTPSPQALRPTGDATASARASIAPWRTVITGAPQVTAESTLYAPPYTEWCATTPSASRDTATASTASPARVRAANRPATSRPSTEFDTRIASGRTSAAAAASASTTGTESCAASPGAVSTVAAPSSPARARQGRGIRSDDQRHRRTDAGRGAEQSGGRRRKLAGRE